MTQNIEKKTSVKDLKLPIILVAEILLCLMFADLVPEALRSLSFTISTTIKAILVAALPAIIFAFLLSTIASLKEGALSFVAIVFGMVFLSNFMGVSVAGFFGSMIMNGINITDASNAMGADLPLMWSLPNLHICNNDTALMIGVASGIFVNYTRWNPGMKLAATANAAANFFLKKLFVPVIPLFILGFMFNIEYKGILEMIVEDYTGIFLSIVVFSFGYIFLLFGLATNFRPSKWLPSIRNMIPASITGLCTMSSTSALPLVADAAEKNTGSDKARGIVPMTINTHLLGDCFAIPFLALAIMLSFGYELPSMTVYMTFALYYALNKFAAAGVPGGGVLIMLPVMEAHLGFSGEMLSLITAIYILFDPIVTSANVTGNGALAQITHRILRKIRRERPAEVAAQ